MSRRQANGKQNTPHSPTPTHTPVGGLVGEGVPPASEAGVPEPSPVPGLAEVLADFGVWLLDERRREALAADLADDGATVADLERVCDYVERQAGHDPKTTGQRLALILRPGVWQRTAETARKHEHRAPAPKQGPDHGETRRAEDDRERHAGRDENYLAGWAFTRMEFDQKKPREVAVELGIGVDKLSRLVRAGAIVYGVDPDRAVDRLLMGAKA